MRPSPAAPAARAGSSGPEHRVDVITALKAMTIWPAYHHFEEKTKGSLAPGKLADFAILSKDPTAVEPSTIADIKVTETVKEGKTIFKLAPGARPKAAGPTSVRCWRPLAGIAARSMTAVRTTRCSG